MTVRPDGTHLTDLLKHHQWMYVNTLSGLPEPAQWSPDGSRLLFLATQAYGAYSSVFSIRPNGRHLTRLG
jgi:hypothetical protein